MIYACMNNDSSWFSNWGHIELCWNYIQELIDSYDRRFILMSKGSNGD